jgi:hypothetical protein
MISRRRYGRMLQTLDCRGLSPHARGPPQWAGVHDSHPGSIHQTRDTKPGRRWRHRPQLKSLLIPTIHTEGMA